MNKAITVQIVKNIDAAARQWVQHVLGRTLRDEQRLIISVEDEDTTSWLKSQEETLNTVWDNKDDAVYDEV